MRISRYRVLALVAQAQSVSCDVQSPPGRLGLDPSHRDLLARWARATTTPQRVIVRSVVVLLAKAGWRNAHIASDIGVSRRTVALWKQRFESHGPMSLLVDAPGRGRKPGRDMRLVERILTMTVEPPPLASRWTVRSLARAVGASHATVQRVWREHGLTPVRPPGGPVGARPPVRVMADGPSSDPPNQSSGGAAQPIVETSQGATL
jgi:transposase